MSFFRSRSRRSFRGRAVYGVLRRTWRSARGRLAARRRRGGVELRAASVTIVEAVYIFVSALAALDHLLSTSLAGITTASSF
jgi:hypothetical protein